MFQDNFLAFWNRNGYGFLLWSVTAVQKLYYEFDLGGIVTSVCIAGRENLIR